jgi:RNA polymerase sigma-70 factor (ECF subfamily)
VTEAVLTMTAGREVADDVDTRLVAAFRGGDRQAFEALVRRHQGPGWSVAMRFAKDGDAAKDLVQRAFLQALGHVAGLRGAFRPWFLRIVVNLARNHVRDHAKFLDGPAHEPAYEAAADEAIDTARRRARVRGAMAQLGERQQEVLQLRVDAQLSFAEVAEALGITENNAKVTYHHAVRRLRELVGEEEA